jgi:hypothetical protein
MIVDFCKKWTIHALDEVNMFFGIRFICSDHCVTLDQTHKIKDIIVDVFGPSHDKQLGNKGYSTPMIAGTEHANDLAACKPYTPAKLIIAQKQRFAFGYCHALGGCMHCALWTRLDILTACLVLAQYQASPGSLHFQALKHLVGYLCLHPDIPLTFTCSTIPKNLSSINFYILDPPLVAQVNLLNLEIVPTQANTPHDSDPAGFTSCDNFFLTHEAPMGKRSPLTDGAIPNSTQKSEVAVDTTIKGEINRISPPITECLVNANLPGGLYERMATSGGSIEMGGTTVISIAQKQTTMAESSTEAELAAAAYLGKILRWLVLSMNNMGLPFIAHSGKITCNVRHVAIKTLALQGFV